MHQVARFILIITIAITFIVELTRFPNHFSDTAWPEHAKSHLMSQISILVGFSGTVLVLIWKNFNSSARWLWWILWGYGLFTFGGYWLGKLLFEESTPWRSGNFLFPALTLTYIAGLIISRRSFFTGLTNRLQGNEP